MTRRRYLGVGLISAVLTGLVACGGGNVAETNDNNTSEGAQADCESVDKVAVRLSYLVFAAHIPMTSAEKQGFYKDNCIDVEILKGQGSSFSTQVVGSGKEEFGYAADTAVLTAASQGVPVVGIADLYATGGQALFATEDSGIESPADLKGHTMGVFVGSATEILTKAMLKKNGLGTDDVRLVSVRPGSDLQLVLEDKIDAEISYWNNDLIDWQLTHPELKLKVWKLEELGLDVPGEGLITSRKMIEDNPDLVKRFVDATLKGATWAAESPDDAVDALIAQFPELKAEVETEKWTAWSSVLTTPMGSYDEAKWAGMSDLLAEYESIRTQPELSSVYTEEFLP